MLRDPLLIDLPPHALDSPLLIEASAGTGKTYTLIRLALAYIVYKKIPIDHIHITTFSRSAVTELKYRLNVLIREYLNDKSLSPEIRNTLLKILPDFDKLNIVTLDTFIHQNFQKFALHMVLDSNFKTSFDKTWLYEIAYDYFRENIQVFEHDKQLELGFYAFFSLIKVGNNFKKIISWLVDNILQNPFLNKESIYPSQAESEKNWDYEKKYFNGQHEIYNCYHQDFLHGNNDLRESILQKKLAVRATTLTELLLLFRTNFSDNYTPWKKLQKYCKKYGFCQQLYTLLEPLVNSQTQSNSHLAKMASYFLRDFTEKTVAILEKNRNMKGIMRMADTTSYLFNIMQTQPCQQFLYPQETQDKAEVVLIDEFQDTNFFQWTIVRNLFSPEKFPNRTYALIGDPKQLIYFFRGTNPKTYVDAKKFISHTKIHYISNNFRSQPHLICAINQWFSQIFSHTEHGYTPVESATPDPYILHGPKMKTEVGITFLTPSREELLSNFKSPLKKKELFNAICTMYTQKILQLIYNPDYFLLHTKTHERKKIEQKDIACLVSKNEEAQLLKSSLEKSGLSVIFSQSQSSIYESEEFELIFDFLTALTYPKNTGLLNKVLLSPLFGFAPEQLIAHEENFILLDTLHTNLITWRDLVNRQNFVKVFDKVLQEYNYYERILQQPEGNRKFVNMRHLIAITLREEQSLGFNSSASILCQRLKILAKQITEKDENLLRLETETNAVRISTIHDAKGLEFPIVFGIFDLGSLSRKKQGFTTNDGFSFIVDLAQSKDHIHHNLLQSFEESLRKFYVLATRSKSHLFLPLLPLEIDTPYFQSLAQLITNPELVKSVFELRLVSERKIIKENVHLITQVLKEVINLAENPKSPFSLEEIANENITSYNPNQENKLPHQQTNFSLSIAQLTHKGGFYHRTLYTSSYTSLWKKTKSEEDPQHSHENFNFMPTTRSQSCNENKDFEFSPLTIPGGTNFGNLVHKIMEILPFHYANQELLSFCSDPQVGSLIDGIFIRYLSPQFIHLEKYVTIVKTMIWSTLNTIIPGISYWKLCHLEEHKKVHEIKFLIHTAKSTRFPLHNTHINIKMGYIQGTLDIVFSHDDRYYIIDWKTTYLGIDHQNYTKEAIHKTMKVYGYDLQASLYLYALGKYLCTTYNLIDPSPLIGGVIYSFTRRSKPDSSQSIYIFEKPYQEIKQLFD